MNGLLALLSMIVCALIVLGVPVLVSPWGAEYGVATVFDTGRAILLCVLLASIAAFVMSRNTESGEFLLKIFAAGLIIRLILGTAIFVFRGQDFFGGDALTYDYLGEAQLKFWGGDRYYWQVM